MNLNGQIKKIGIALGIIFFLGISCFSQEKRGMKVLLIPLDDRPTSVQFPIKMGLIGDAEVVAPPKNLLGKFTEAGNSDAIIEWLGKQDLQSFDAAIISVDMLAYGGLVAMRVHETSDAVALKRLGFLRELRKRVPQMKIYGSSVIMRLAPTGTGANEAYRENLSKWAEISVDANLKSETAQLEQKIPAAALADYKAARVRDLKINRETVNLVRDKVFDYLILSQDDAKPKGIHVADRENLIALTKKLKLTEKIAVQPGADEVSMLLLARVLTDKYNFHSKIKAVYSSEEASRKVMPFEDRPLRETVSYHIKATGAQEVQNEKDADLLFYVFASRHESGNAEKFAAEIESKIQQNKRIIVADIDPKGDVQGGDVAFTEQLGNHGIFPKLNGYAAWNTAGNTVGTTVPHGVIFALAQNKFLSSDNSAARVLTAQNWFTIHRILDDYYFHNVVRAQAKKFIVENKWNAFRLSDEETQKVEDLSGNLLTGKFQNLEQIYPAKSFNFWRKNLKCEKPSNLSFDLPWNRTFEAEIDFTLQCRLSSEN